MPMSYLYVAKKKNRGDGILNFSTTVLASLAVALSSAWLTSTPHFTFDPRSRRLFIVKATSSAPNGVPSLHLIPERVLIVNCLKSGVNSKLSASHIYHL